MPSKLGLTLLVSSACCGGVLRRVMSMISLATCDDCVMCDVWCDVMWWGGERLSCKNFELIYWVNWDHLNTRLDYITEAYVESRIRLKSSVPAATTYTKLILMDHWSICFLSNLEVSFWFFNSFSLLSLSHINSLVNRLSTINTSYWPFVHSRSTCRNICTKLGIVVQSSSSMS